jgi:hypothetical protein
MLLPLLDMNVNRILLQQTLDLYAVRPLGILIFMKKNTLLLNFAEKVSEMSQLF